MKLNLGIIKKAKFQKVLLLYLLLISVVRLVIFCIGAHYLS